MGRFWQRFHRHGRGALGVAAAVGAAVLGACDPDTAPAGDAAVAQPTANAQPTASSGPTAAAARPPAAPGGARRVEVGGVDLTGIGYDKGDPAAPVVIVDFSDFGCPYCGVHSRETLPALEREFIATGKVFYKYVPVVMGFPNGDVGARAAACAAEQGRFWPMHDRLYATQSEWRPSRAPGPLFARAAVALGLDARRFAACSAAPRAGDASARATALATQLGVRATPTFVVNGRPIEGALPLAQFRQVLADPVR